MSTPSGEHRVRRSLVGAVLTTVMVALLALAVAGPALAHPPVARAKARPFACQATVTAVDTSAATFAATVTRAARPMKRCVGAEVTFAVTERTVLVKAGSKPAVRITLADLHPGDRVLILGRVDRSDPNAPTFTVRLVVLLRAAPAQT